MIQYRSVTVSAGDVDAGGAIVDIQLGVPSATWAELQAAATRNGVTDEDLIQAAVNAGLADTLRASRAGRTGQLASP